MSVRKRTRQKFKYHIPGQMAGDFLCQFDEHTAGEWKTTIHLETLPGDIFKRGEQEVCVKCLQLHCRSLQEALDAQGKTFKV